MFPCIASSWAGGRKKNFYAGKPTAAALEQIHTFKKREIAKSGSAKIPMKPRP
jgi:hypothetical protein